MAYGRTQEEAKKRVYIKRQLRALGFHDFHSGEQTRSLREKLRYAKQVHSYYEGGFGGRMLRKKKIREIRVI